MLETIREFADEQLTASGEANAARNAHARYFTQFAETYEFADLMPSTAYAIERLEIERANLQVALAWLAQADDTEHFLRLVAAHGNYWAASANYHEARFWYERALAAAQGHSSNHRAKIQVLLAMTELLQGGIVTSEALFSEGLAACRTHDEPYYAAYALLGAATAAILQDDGARGARLLHECRLEADRIPDRRLAELVRGMVSLNLAVVSRASGNLDLAAAQITDMLHRSRAEDYQLGMLIALGDLGDLARDRTEWNQALASYREALLLGRAHPVKRVLIEVIESVAIVASRTGQFDRSATLLGAAEGLRERTGLRYRQPENSASLTLAIEANRVALGDHAFAAKQEHGRNLSADRIISAALEVQDRSTVSVVIAADPTRNRNRPLARPRHDRPGNRRRPLHQRPHRRKPRRPHPRQTRRPHPHRRRLRRHRRRPRPPVLSSNPILSALPFRQARSVAIHGDLWPQTAVSLLKLVMRVGSQHL